MILVFLLFGFIIIFALIVYTLLLSSIKIKINKLHILKYTDRSEIKLISKVGIYLFKKFKLVEFKIDDDRIKEIYYNGKISIRQLKENKMLNKEIIKLLRKLSFTIEKLKLEGYIGTEDAAVTAYLIGIANSIIPLLIHKNLSNINQYKNSVSPIYINQNVMNINLKLSININIISIINVLIQNCKARKQEQQEIQRHIYS